MTDLLVQTTLPPAVAAWVKDVAAREGLSVAAWLRRVVMIQQRQAVVRAWIHGAKDPKDAQHLQKERRTPTFFLEKIESYSDGAVEFRAMHGDGKPFTEKALGDLSYETLRYNLAVGWLALDGSLTPWMMVHSMADANAGGQLVIRLRPILHGQRTFDVTPSYWRALSLGDPRRHKAENVFSRMLPPGILKAMPETASELSFTLPEGHPMSDADAAWLQSQLLGNLESLQS